VASINTARRLRRNQTDAEKLLWSRLRDRQLAGWKFRRQVLIGADIVDFLCAERRLIVELDGGQHNDNPTDGARDAWLGTQGYQILRFWNHDLLANLHGALETISAALNTPHPPTASRRAPPSPARGEGMTDGASLG
jgi:very-short-patch-repair endonuclease